MSATVIHLPARPPLRVRVQLPRPHAGQARVIREARRYNVVTCGRRWGKTDLGVDRAIDGIARGWPVGWFAPTYKLLADAWRLVLRRAAPLVCGSDKQERRIEFLTGGTLEFWTMDSPDAGRSRKYKRALVDEAAMAKALKDSWEGAIRPTLADLEGDAWFYSTPRGFDYYNGLHMMETTDPEWKSWQMPTHTNPYIKPSELAAARRVTDDRYFAQEYEASFEHLANRVYHKFHFVDNCRPIVDRLGPLLVGLDFNVNPMTAVICQRAADELEQLGEVVLNNSDTVEMCQAIRQAYPGLNGAATKRAITVCPDPSGNSRKSSARGQTDFTILREHGFEVVAPKAAPPITDRINEVNALCCNAEGRRRYWVDPVTSPVTVKGLNQLTYKKGTQLVDKGPPTAPFEHITSALGYLVHVEFPIVGITFETRRVGGV